MSLEALTPWLFSRTAGGIRWGLERTRELLAGVGDPHRHFRSLHIGGTNGKGSVAALCSAALVEEGRGRVGLYTSPHLISFAERVRIDGRVAADELILHAAERLRAPIERTGATFFEAATAIAFLAMAEAEVEVAVVEVGLGGRLDATNVIDPVACAITNVTREHTEYLGETLREIAREKAGILKPGVPAVTGATGAESLPVLQSEANRVGAPLAELDRISEVEIVQIGTGGTRFRLGSAAWGERDLRVALAGAHQARNAALAAELLVLLPADLRPSWAAVERGFAQVRWAGRLQIERRSGTTWLFDVAHNPAGAAALARALDTLDLPRPLVLLFGVLADKDVAEMLAPLLGRVDGAVFSVPPSAAPDRRWDPGSALDALSAIGGPIPRVIPNFDEALSRAATLAPHGTIVVTGSFHTVGDAMAALGIDAAEPHSGLPP